jgi:hypothetical protein
MYLNFSFHPSVSFTQSLKQSPLQSCRSFPSHTRECMSPMVESEIEKIKISITQNWSWVSLAPQMTGKVVVLRNEKLECRHPFL